MAGIEKSKGFIDLLVKSIDAWNVVYEDGSVDLADFPEIWGVISIIGPVIASADQLPKEAADYSSEEIQALSEYLTSTIELDDAKAKVLLEKSLKAVHALWEVYDLIKPEDKEK